MKITTVLASVLTISLLTGCMCERHHQKEAKLQAEAKITKADAQATALAQVPNGIVKEGELEKEHGKLIWSFDITTPDSKDITEVNVDAITGKVISKEQESPEKEAKEKGHD